MEAMNGQPYSNQSVGVSSGPVGRDFRSLIYRFRIPSNDVPKTEGDGKTLGFTVA